MTSLSKLMQEHIKKNATVAQSQEAYALKTERIEKRYNTASRAERNLLYS